MSENASISHTQYDQVIACLTELLKKLRLKAVLVVNSSGRIIAEKIRQKTSMETTTLATLASGSYAAAAEMARQLGEHNHFKMMLHEGHKQNVFISSITDDFFLIIVFETDVALGMVRLFAKRTMVQLNPILSEKPKNQFAELFDQHFQGLLNEKLDQAFLDE
ncbi:roadblock/LC7 domain-containing protein [bacterium]|nr:roadblock/LC7 domain-containing protein [bacterium]